MNTTQQLTIRGVDEATKNILVARARQHGISLNAYSLNLLRQDVGTNTTMKKTNGLERFIGIGPLSPEVDEALHNQHKTIPDKWDSYGL
jgi:hypothetical protein